MVSVLAILFSFKLSYLQNNLRCLDFIILKQGIHPCLKPPIRFRGLHSLWPTESIFNALQTSWYVQIIHFQFCWTWRFQPLFTLRHQIGWSQLPCSQQCDLVNIVEVTLAQLVMVWVLLWVSDSWMKGRVRVKLNVSDETSTSFNCALDYLKRERGWILWIIGIYK